MLKLLEGINVSQSKATEGSYPKFEKKREKHPVGRKWIYP